MKSIRCESCNRFRKAKDVRGFGGEDNEEWTECRHCMSDADFKDSFPNETREVNETQPQDLA